MQNTYIPNILFVGNNTVGKTTLIGRLSGLDMNYQSTRPTIFSDYVRKSFTIGGSSNRVTLETRLYDQQFSMSGSPPSIMRYKDIIVLVWSLTDTESYRNIGQHLKTILSIFDTSQYTTPDIVLCANKWDCTTRDEEYSLCRERYSQYPIVKLSATKGTGIEALESEFCKILLRRHNERSEQQLRDDTVSIGDNDPDTPNRSEPNCC